MKNIDKLIKPYVGLDYIENKSTPLIDSIMMEDYEQLKSILEYGVDLELCIDKEYTAAHFAIEWDDKKAFNLLLEYGLNPFLTTEKHNQNLAHYAARTNPDFLCYLYELNIDFNETDKFCDNVWDLLQSKSPEKIPAIKKFIQTFEEKNKLDKQIKRRKQSPKNIL